MGFDPEIDIQNSNLLTGIFGGWPSFHDGEITALHLGIGASGATLEIDIHLWEITDSVDQQGFYETKNHVLATLAFMNVEGCELKDFGRQNVIYRLEVSPNYRRSRAYFVDISPSNGCDLRFTCSEIKVTSVTPHSSSR